MQRVLITALFIAGTCLANCGCSYRLWHAGLQEGQRQECYKMPSPEAMQECLKKVNSMNYDQYQKARQAEQQK